VLVVAIGCGASAAVANQEPIYQISEDDAEMNAAKRQAIDSLPQFYARLAEPAADESEFMVKFDILPGDEAEFVWADQLDRSATPMTGVLINQPERTDHQIGQRVSIAEADIIDWTYRRGRVMQGGFTNRVLLRHMSPEDAAAMRQYFGW
jgi:uncharacterized protein YegJ (DUF2314 family)